MSNWKGNSCILLGLVGVMGYHVHERSAWRAEIEALNQEVLKVELSEKGIEAGESLMEAESQILPVARFDMAVEHILEQLLESVVPESPEFRIKAMQEVCYKLVVIAKKQDAALPDLKNFINSRKDRNYPILIASEGKFGTGIQSASSEFRPWVPLNRPTFEFAFPPTLRIGLIGCLERIGSKRSIEVLESILKKSSSGVEVSLAFRALERLMPGKWNEPAKAAAQEILQNPAHELEQDLLHKHGKDYLFAMLMDIGDSAYIDNIENLMVSEDGRLERGILNYVRSVLGADGVPIYEELFRNEDIRDLRERFFLVGLASDYVGQSRDADRFVESVITDADYPSMLRMRAAQSLNGFNLFVNERVELSEPIAKRRIELIEEMLPSIPAEESDLRMLLGATQQVLFQQQISE